MAGAASPFYRAPCVPSEYEACARYCQLTEDGRVAHLSNDEFMQHVTARRKRVVFVEWDAFDAKRFELNAVFATMLREPMARLRSLYVYEHLERRDMYAAQNNGKTLSFGRWREWRRRETTNAYVRMLSNNQEPSRAALRVAAANLRRFDAVLVLERLNASAALMRARFGWRVPPPRAVLNASKTKNVSISDEVWRRARDDNQLDFELYTLANRLLDGDDYEIAVEAAAVKTLPLEIAAIEASVKTPQRSFQLPPLIWLSILLLCFLSIVFLLMRCARKKKLKV